MVISIKRLTTYVKKVYQKQRKKADRIAAEGSAYVEVEGNDAVLLEVNCETDFVTKNDQFKSLLQALAKHILSEKPGSVEEALAQPLNGEGEKVEEFINSNIAKIGEKNLFTSFCPFH